jgi:alpha-glucosidase (family GH31 glycosyl hydrolase)
VLTKGAVARDLYLPAGRWRDLKRGTIVDGGRWLRGHPAPLDTLPIFVRAGSAAEKLATAK